MKIHELLQKYYFLKQRKNKFSRSINFPCILNIIIFILINLPLSGDFMPLLLLLNMGLVTLFMIFNVIIWLKDYNNLMFNLIISILTATIC